MLRGIWNMLEDILYMLASAGITGLSVFIGSYAMAKIMIKKQKKELKQEAENWLNSEVGQKALYMIGGLIANGAKQGFGLETRRGKGGLEGMAIELIGRYIGSKLPQITQQTQTMQQGGNDVPWPST